MKIKYSNGRTKKSQNPYTELVKEFGPQIYILQEPSDQELVTNSGIEKALQSGSRVSVWRNIEIKRDTDGAYKIASVVKED